jgi:hypothetical protein
MDEEMETQEDRERFAQGTAEADGLAVDVGNGTEPDNENVPDDDEEGDEDEAPDNTDEEEEDDDEDDSTPPAPAPVDVPPGSMSGGAFLAALDFALTACPKEPHTEALQHLVFSGRRVVGSDGRRRHDGYLPDGVTVDTPAAFTRASVDLVQFRLKHAAALARRRTTQCLVWLHLDALDTAGAADPHVEIRVGDEHPVRSRLYRANVGEIVDGADPVPATLPDLQMSSTGIPAGLITDMEKCFKRVWGNRKGSLGIRGRGGRNPLRIECKDGDGELIGCAFVQPCEVPPAALPMNEPLLAGAGGDELARQQSVMALRWDPPTATKAATPQAVRDLLPAPAPGSAPAPTIEQPATPAEAVPSSTKGPRKAPPPPKCPAIVETGGTAWSVMGPLRCSENGVPRSHGFCGVHVKQYDADNRREIARVARLEKAQAAGNGLPGETASGIEEN